MEEELNTRLLYGILNKISGLTDDIRGIHAGLTAKIYLQKIRDFYLGASSTRYGDLDEAVYLQQIRDAISGIRSSRYGDLDEVIYLQQIRDLMTGTTTIHYGNLDKTFYLKQILNCSSIDRYFDHGAFASVNVTGLDSLSPVIRINPFLDVIGGNKTQWWAARLKRYEGKTPTFVVNKSTYWIAYSTSMWHGVWATSLDTDDWYKFDNSIVGASDYSFWNNSPFPGNCDIFVALAPLYPFSRTQRLVSKWSLSSKVGDTLSSVNKILSLSSAVAPDAMGKSPLNLPYYAFKVYNITAYAKNKAIYSSRQHACEPQGGFAFEGGIEWLLTTGEEQKFFLDYFDLLCYPCLYPLNVWAGHSRDLWNNYAIDVNSRWGTTGDEYVNVFKAAMLADSVGKIAAGFDCHSYVDSANATMGDQEDSSLGFHIALKNEMLKYDLAYTLFQETLPNCIPHWWQYTLGAAIATHQEQKLGSARTIANWKEYGKNTLLSLEHLLANGIFSYGPLSGCREFNGTTDRIDWASIYNPAGTATTISVWVKLDVINTASYILSIGDGTTFGMTVMASGAATVGSLELLVSGAAPMARITVGSVVKAGIWTNIIMIYDGTFGSYTHCKIYVNGVECTYSDGGSLTGTAPEGAHTGSWSAGGRIVDDARNFDGRIAQIAVWDRVLTAGEIVNVSGGNSPDYVPTNLRFWFPGDTSDLHDLITTTLGSVDGTSSITGVTNGPVVGSRRMGAAGTDLLSWASIFAPTQAEPFTFSVWVNLSSVAASQALFSITTGMYIWLPTGNLTAVQMNWDKSVGTNMFRRSADSVMSTGSWINIVVTFAGDWTDYTHVRIYKNGVEVSYAAGVNGAGTPLPNTGAWNVGAFDADNYEILGMVAQSAYWDRVLTPTEIANLGKGYCPSLIATPRFYWRGDTSDLHDAITSTLGTATGTLQKAGVGNGPGITYP
jgi:hypothetical protein